MVACCMSSSSARIKPGGDARVLARVRQRTESDSQRAGADRQAVVQDHQVMLTGVEAVRGGGDVGGAFAERGIENGVGMRGGERRPDGAFEEIGVEVHVGPELPDHCATRPVMAARVAMSMHSVSGGERR